MQFLSPHSRYIPHPSNIIYLAALKISIEKHKFWSSSIDLLSFTCNIVFLRFQICSQFRASSQTLQPTLFPQKETLTIIQNILKQQKSDI